ncbi:MAG: SDR family oxidoreductase [Pirellulales bacterium]|nr:SDR family oxidoreductase [Pirellulales bacterium]
MVTGSGAPRVGNVVVRRLAAEGYRVVVHANRSVTAAEATVAELQSDGTDALAVVGDLRDEAIVRRVVDESITHFGQLDALVNCAAVWRRKPLEETTASDVRDQFECNTLSTFLCCQHAGLAMAAQASGGVIVNVGDWATARPYRDYAAYFASKGAIETLTRTFAIELAARNPRVRVNAVLPGPVMLPPELSSAERAVAVAGTLLQREGSPAHVADAVVFLLRNDFVTGVCLPVDGGRTVKPYA